MIEVATGVVILTVVAAAVVLWRATRPSRPHWFYDEAEHPPWVSNPDADWDVPRKLDEDEVSRPSRGEPETWEVAHDSVRQHRGDGRVDGWQAARYEHSVKDCTNAPFCMCSCKTCQAGDHADRVPGS